MPALEDEPYLTPAQQELINAFFWLSPTRTAGFDRESGIATAEIIAFCDIHGIEPEFRVRFADHIRELDGDFLDFRAEQAKSTQ